MKFKLIATIFYSILSIFLLTSCSERSNHNDEEVDQTDIIISQKQWYDLNEDKINQRPKWIDTIPIVVAGGWDSEPATQRRWGRLAVNYLEEYEKRISEENVIKLKESGITLVITHYFKGFGIEGEGIYMDNTRKFTELCHKQGLRVGAYFGNTLITEQLLLELPEAEQWMVPDYQGKPVTYSGTQTFRRIPYIGHPGYQKYIKKVLNKAVLEAKIDLIHFDNSVGYGRPENFHHPLAIEQFREYLRKKYSPDELEDRFDLRDVSFILPPHYNGTPQPIQDPLFQEWTDFRCQKVGDYLLEMRRYIKSLNPDVVVESNPHGEKGENNPWTRGVDWPRILASTSAFWSEGGAEPGLTDNGTLVNQIRSYKIGRTFGNVSFVQLGHDRLRMAESMAYNQNCLGYVGALLSHNYWDEETRQFVKYYRDHFQYYKNTKSNSSVAILRTFSTMAYGSLNTQYSTLLYEQSLIQSRTPFDIIFDQHLEEDLSKYQTLVLANQECLSDIQIEQIKNYVKNGGGLVITGKTSLYNEFRRRRNQLGFRDMFKEDLPYPPGSKVSQHPWSLDSKWYRHGSWVQDLQGFTDEKTGVIQGNYGKGRVVYIPQIKPSISKSSNIPPSSKYWKLPNNNLEMVEAIRWAYGDHMPIEIDAPPYVTMEWLSQDEQNRTIVHLVNYGGDTHPLVKDIVIDLKIPSNKSVKSIRIFSPELTISGEQLDYNKEEGRLSITVPSLIKYDMVAIQYE